MNQEPRTLLHNLCHSFHSDMLELSVSVSIWFWKTQSEASMLHWALVREQANGKRP